MDRPLWAERIINRAAEREPDRSAYACAFLSRYREAVGRQLLDQGDPITQTVARVAECQRLVAVRAKLAGQPFDPQDVDTFHVTLAYFPDCSDEQMGALQKDLLMPVPFSLEVRGYRYFSPAPGAHPPLGAIVLDLVATPALLRLQSEIINRAISTGLILGDFCDARSYTPHITLGYTRQPDGFPRFGLPFKVWVYGWSITRSDYDVKSDILLPWTREPGSLVQGGGPGSGDVGHAGRPGEVGGSAPGLGGQMSGLDLYRYQDSQIEKLPKQVANRDYGLALEGTGDVFREVAQNQDESFMRYGAPQYPEEKIGRLEHDMDVRLARALPKLEPGDPDLALANEIGRKFEALGPLRDPVTEAARQLNLAVVARDPARVRATIADFRQKLGAGTAAVKRQEAEGSGAQPASDFAGEYPTPLGGIVGTGTSSAEIVRGGEGSGDFEHAGRPGEQGGSLPGTGDDRENFRGYKVVHGKYHNAGKVALEHEGMRTDFHSTPEEGFDEARQIEHRLKSEREQNQRVAMATDAIKAGKYTPEDMQALFGKANQQGTVGHQNVLAALERMGMKPAMAARLVGHDANTRIDEMGHFAHRPSDILKIFQEWKEGRISIPYGRVAKADLEERDGAAFDALLKSVAAHLEGDAVGAFADTETEGQVEIAAKARFTCQRLGHGKIVFTAVPPAGVEFPTQGPPPITIPTDEGPEQIAADLSDDLLPEAMRYYRAALEWAAKNGTVQRAIVGTLEERIFTYAVERGGEGSGDFGHPGRPGEQGGSAPSGMGVTSVAKETEKAAASGKVHRFEAAGLGKAPYRFREMWVAPSPSTMGTNPTAWALGMQSMPRVDYGGPYSCAYCGTAITNHCLIESADGKHFMVGTDCVEKTGDAGLIDPVKVAAAEARHEAAARALGEHIDAARKNIQDLVGQNRPAFEAIPHPHAGMAAEGKTYADYLDYFGEKVHALSKAESVLKDAKARLSGGGG